MMNRIRENPVERMKNVIYIFSLLIDNNISYGLEYVQSTLQFLEENNEQKVKEYFNYIVESNEESKKYFFNMKNYLNDEIGLFIYPKTNKNQNPNNQINTFYKNNSMNKNRIHQLSLPEIVEEIKEKIYSINTLHIEEQE